MAQVIFFASTALADQVVDTESNADGLARTKPGLSLCQSAKLLANEGVARDEFGGSLSVSGDVALVGAVGYDNFAQLTGAAYVFRWSGTAWVQEQQLLADDGSEGDVFGRSVSISGNVALVGALGGGSAGPNTGSAYIFRWNGNTWIQEQKLLAKDGASNDQFGGSVSIWGDIAVIGAVNNDDYGSASGSAYVFRRNGSEWVQEQKLLPSSGASGDFFGWSVSVSGDVVLIGAIGGEGIVSTTGSAYVFRWNGATWVQEQQLLPSDGTYRDYFGWSVSVSENVALIGAKNDDDGGTDSGSAYVFRWSGSAWTQEQKLLPSDGASDDSFGWSVSISGDVAFVGARNDDDNGTDSGSAYLFRWNGADWIQYQKLLSYDGESADYFGTSVSVSGDVTLVGAPSDDDTGADSGAIYAFSSSGSDCNQNGVPDRCDIASGTSIDSDNDGVPDICTDYCELANLLNSEVLHHDLFGRSVSIWGDRGLVGAPGGGAQATSPGSAHLFRWNGSKWNFEQKLLPNDGDAGDSFGSSVSVFGDVVLVGAQRDDDNGSGSGSAYVFWWNGSEWIQEQKLMPDDGESGEEFGISVSVSASVALIGARLDDDNGSNSGSAYVFRWNGTDWNQEQKLLPHDGSINDEFGAFVSLSGDVALVGARNDNDNGTWSGSAYVFRWNGSEWHEEQKLLPSDGWLADYFGTSVSVSDDIALVGAIGDDDNGPGSGSAYVFRWDGTSWIQEQKLLPTDGASGDDFGWSVSVSGDLALVGASWDDENGLENSGSAYVFRWDGIAWTQVDKLLANRAGANDFFGDSVSVSGDFALIGAWQDDENGENSGSASVFITGLEDCNQNSVFDACEIGVGDSGDCDGNNEPDECQVPQVGDVVSNWIGNVGLWDDPPENIDWCLPEVPDNNTNATFDVLVEGPGALLVLNRGPTIRSLRLIEGAVVVVDDRSGANARTLTVDEPIINEGIFRASDRERLVLDAPVIDQGGFCGKGGALEAVDGVVEIGKESERSVLEIKGARVLGGSARVGGPNSEIHLIDRAELVDVCIGGVVVPNGQTGEFSGTLVNDGLLIIRADQENTTLEPASANAVLASPSGTGCVRLTSQAHARLGDLKQAFRNANGHTIDGAGIVVGNLTNDGVIDANSLTGQHLVLFPSIEPHVNGGLMRATGQGTLRIETEVNQFPEGRIEASNGGTVAVNDDVGGIGGLLAAGGEIVIQDVRASFGRCIEVPPPADGFESRLRIIGSTVTASDPSAPNDLSITGGIVSLSEQSDGAFSSTVSVCPANSEEGALSISDSTFRAGSLEVCEDGLITTTNGALSVMNFLAFANTNETDWSWNYKSTLSMTGGQGLIDDDPSHYAALEVGGEDFGTDPANHVGDQMGFVANFSLPELVIGPGAHVSLVDRLDNGNRIQHGFGSDEALYTKRLRFADASGRLNLNGLHLYFNQLVGAPTQIIDLPRHFGDYDTDCDVDLKDTAALQICMTSDASGHACRVFDTDESGAVEANDLFGYFRLMTGPACEQNGRASQGPKH